MSETEAQAAFETHLIELVRRPETIWVNQRGEGVPRLEVNHGPLARDTITTQGGGKANLMSQIDVVVAAGTGPDNGGSADEPGMRSMMQAVIDHFPFNLRLGTAKVYARPEAGGMRKDGEEFRVSLTIRYRICQ